MFDLHSHILPQLDDGAKDEKTALAMLQMAAANGTRGIVATPHVIEGDWLPSWDSILAGCHRLADLAKVHGIAIAVYPGAEVAVSYELLSLLATPGPYCLNGSRYLLLELPAVTIPAYAEEFFFTLQTRGFLPILAHPERNQELRQRPEQLQDWIGKGLLVQINAASITGQMGKAVMRFAELLVHRRMVHCLGSDAHGINHRRPVLLAAVNKIATLAGARAAEEITGLNPGKILAGEEIPLAEIHSLQSAGSTVFDRLARLWKFS